MSLALSRHSGESIFLHLAPDADVDKLLKQLATTGIKIRLGEITGSRDHGPKSTSMRPMKFP